MYVSLIMLLKPQDQWLIQGGTLGVSASPLLLQHLSPPHFLPL